MPPTDPSPVTVEELNVYPLKSGRGISKTLVRLVTTGCEWDRHWMITDQAGVFLSQRTHPRLAHIQPEISGDALTLRARDMSPLVLPLEPQGTPFAVQVWKDRCDGLDQGDNASSWASAILGAHVRVVRVVEHPRRMASAEFAGPVPMPVAFSDGFPILICNRASLDDLNARMPEPVPMERFRPNIVLTGLPPFAEDRIASLQIGSATLSLVKPCTRCVITSTDQRTGERTTNPLPVLRKFRFNKSLLGVTFGENAVITAGTGTSIRKGAECIVNYEH